jgi:hypothetical protein
MPDDAFAPERWELTTEPSPGSATTKRRPRLRQTERFLRGPVPWPWLRRAMRLPGKALAVGLILWLQGGITGRRTVTFCLARAEANGIPVTTARRAIRELERDGLVLIIRRPGHGLDVTLLDVTT